MKAYKTRHFKIENVQSFLIFRGDISLISGNKIKIYNSRNSAYSVYKIIQDNEVNILKLTPTHLSVIENKDLSNSKIQMLIVGGEAFKTSLAKKFIICFQEEL